MRFLVLVALCVCACTPESPAPWRLDRDRVVAVRATPPHLLPGEVSLLDALIAHQDGPTTIEAPVGASAAFAAADLFTAVHFNLDHWQIDGPAESQLAAARAELGLAPDAPVPLEVSFEFPGRLLAKKTVWLGDSWANPTLPPLAALVPALGEAVPLGIAAPADAAVRWLTSCGTLRDADQPAATLVLDEPCLGELAVVLRDARGGVAWQVVAVRGE